MDRIKRRCRHPRHTANTLGSRIVYELSSDEETSSSAKNKPGMGMGEVISLDDYPEPTSSKKIAITIEDTPTKRVTKSTKITIQIDDEGSNSCQIESEVQLASDITSNNDFQRGPDVKNCNCCQSGPDFKNSNHCQKNVHVTDVFQNISEITPINVCKRDFGFTKQRRRNTTDEPTEKIRRVNLISEPKASDEISNKVGETTKNNTDDICKSEMFGEEFKTENTFVQCYVEFMDTCKKIDKSEDMKHILEKKVKPYYRRAEESYVRSHEFEHMIVKCLEKLKLDPFNIWVHIKAVVDALRDRKKSRIVIPESSLCKDPRTLKQIEELEKTLQTLQELVQRLESVEVNFDEEDQSAYLKADKYKAKLVSVHARLCKLRGARASSYSRVRLERRAGRAGGPAAALEEWVNRPVAAGQPPRFPDFHDVVKCVRDACRTDGLSWSDAQVMKEARELFTRCGRALQKIRQRREWRLAESQLRCADGEVYEDPAERSAELQELLARNRTIARQREQQVFDEFENRQIFSKTENKDGSDYDSTEESGKTAQEASQNRNTKLKDSSRGMTQKDEVKKDEVEKNTCEVQNAPSQLLKLLTSKESNENTIKSGKAEVFCPETAAANEPTQAPNNCDRKLKDSSRGMTQNDEVDERKQLLAEKDRCEVQDAPSQLLQLLREKEVVKEVIECEVISSDEESSSDESESSDDSVVILSDDAEEERCAVSDSSVGSGEDELHLLRRVEMRRRGGVRYSTSVTHVRTSSHSDDSDGSACVLIDSHDEDDADDATSTLTNK